MSEYKSQIALGSAIAIILGLSLGLAVTHLPSNIVQSSTTSVPVISASTSTALTVSASSYTATTTYSTMTETVSSSASSTTSSPVIATQSPVEIDPTLNVSLAQFVLLSSNASTIAQRFASALNQSLVGPANVTSGYQSTYYSFTTNINSTITVSFATTSDNFTEVDYRIQNWYEEGNVTTVNSAFSISAANEYSESIMNAVGIPTTALNLTNTLGSFDPNDYQVQWTQSYEGIPLLGALTQNPDGSYFFSSSQAFFDFNPASANFSGAQGELKEAIFVNPYWYIVSSTFPLNISPSNAGGLAEDYAIHELGMTDVSQVQTSFASVNDHLYYVATVSNPNLAYQVFVNPSNGVVGFPK
jgi:hypothetical protein